ncbi:hypothetical protein NL676_024812 [Syzygium grande]|nr:hypothetical protein NL676_024812 [Syzygium grande]
MFVSVQGPLPSDRPIIPESPAPCMNQARVDSSGRQRFWYLPRPRSDPLYTSGAGFAREREKAGVFRTSSSAGPGAGPSAAGPRWFGKVLGLEESLQLGAGAGPSQNPVDDSYMSDSSKKASNISNPQPKDAFHVKSGIWTDSLSRGLIDLNISASKKVSLADVGVVGGLSDGSDERERGPPTSFYMGRAMGTGTDHGMSSFTSSLAIGGDDFFSSFARQSQYGSFKK